MRSFAFPVVCLAALLLAPVGAPGQRCVHYENHVHWLGGEDTVGLAASVAIAGEHAFVGYSNGLQVLDIAEPADPRLIGGLDGLGDTRGVAMIDAHAILASRGSGLHVVDVTAPSAPVLVGHLDTPGEAWCVRVDGTLAFVAARDAGLLVVDVQDPTRPTLLGVADTPGDARGVALRNGRALVADGASGLQVIAVATPSAPVVTGTVALAGTALDVATAGDLACVALHSAGLAVLDLAGAATPRFSGLIALPDVALAVAMTGPTAHVAGGESGLFVVDLATPVAPSLVGHVDTPGEAWGVATAGACAFVADRHNGLQVIDVTGTTDPPLHGAFGAGGVVTGIAVRDGHLLLAAGEAGLVVVDCREPGGAGIVGGITFPDFEALDVAVTGDLACVCARGIYPYLTNRLFVLDVGDPAQPQMVGSLTATYPLQRVAASGELAFAVSDYDLQVIDLSDPTQPVAVGSLTILPAVGHGVDADGRYVYVAAGDAGLLVVDPLLPASPQLVGAVETPAYAMGVAVVGAVAFVADADIMDNAGLQVVDLADPAHPQLGARVNAGDWTESVAVAGGVAYLTVERLGVLVIDVEDPTDPRLLGGFDTGHARDVVVAGSCVAVADDWPGLVLAPHQCESLTGVEAATDPHALPVASLALHPNPCNPATTVAFTLARSASVAVDVHDLAGRRLARLVDRPLPSGQHRVTWQGRADDGRDLPSGTYLVRLRIGTATMSRKLVLVR